MRFNPCAASRLPLKGATLADRQSRIGGVLGCGIARRKARRLMSDSRASLIPSQPGSGHITGMLRVEAVSNRRASAPLGRAWV